jgi:transposase InsO family protein
VIDPSTFHLLLLAVTGWLDCREPETLAYLIEENRLLRRQLGGRRLRLTDDDRRRLAVRAYRLGRVVLRTWRRLSRRTHCCDGTGNWWRAQVDLSEEAIQPPRRAGRNPTLGRAHGRRESHVGVHADPGCPQESRTPGRTLDGRAHFEGPRSATRAEPPDVVADTFLRAHWGAIAGADFFTTEVWTVHGLVTFYAAFVIDLATRRVQVLGITPHPDEAFMRQVVRTLTMVDGIPYRVLICDHDAKWTAAVRERLAEAGIRVVQTPYAAPNANPFAERFVRSLKEECLDRIIPIGERHLRRAVTEFLTHYHRERNHQGLENGLIDGAAGFGAGRVRRQSRLGGLLNFYTRAA